MMGEPDDGFAGEQGEAVVEGTCLPLPELDLSGLGDWPVLGVVPAFVPADPVAWYADGVVPAPRVLADDLPALRARFARAPVLVGAAAALQPVVDTLTDEVGAAWDRDRLARRLFALATLLRTEQAAEAEPDELALEALRCAVADEPSHLLARFALEAMLAQVPGAAVERVTLLEQGPSVADAHRAGHVARTQVGDTPWALDLWWNAAERHPDRLETLLASYLVHLESGDEQAAASLAELLFQAAPGKRFWGVLAADRTSRARPYWPIEQLRADLVATITRSGVSPAVLAVGEELAFSTRDHALARQLLEGRIAEPGVEPAELAVLWARLGWLLEEAGEEEPAREACEKAISIGNAPGYARRRALALARRQGSHALIHRLQSVRADDERLPAGERAAALVERAAADFALERAAEGRLALARAVELDRTCRPALAALGRAALDLDDTPGQLQLFAAELAALEAQGDQPTRIADRAVRLALLRLRAERVTRGTSDGERLGEAQSEPRILRAERVTRGTSDGERLGEAQSEPRTTRTGRELASALDACRRALAAVPGDRDAFLTGADVLARLGQWPALAALYARRAGQLGVELEEAVEYLTLAADIFRARLGDAGSAARLLAQALRLLPQHTPTLERAAEVFALTGQRRAWAEVEARLGDPTRAVRAGRLLEFGDAAEAEVAVAAFAQGGWSPAAIEGSVRAAVRSGNVDALAQVPGEALTLPLVRLTVAEALLAGGRAQAALALLPEGAIAPANPAFYKGFLDLRAVAAAWTGQWSILASTLVAQASLVRGAPRAELLVRAGEVRALRDGDVAGAVELFRQALAADGESTQARQALARWEAASVSGGEGPLVVAAAARRAGDWTRHDATLQAAAQSESRPTEAEGLRRAQGLGSLDAPPHRSDLFATALAQVEDATERARLLGARVEVAAGAERPELLRRRIMACLAAGDLKGCEDAARRLLALEPHSLPAGLALARVAALTQQVGVAREGLEALATAVRAPANQSAVAAARAQVVTDPVSQARERLVAGQLDAARSLIADLPASVEVLRLQAEIDEAAGDFEAALAARTRAFEALEGVEAAALALQIVESLQAEVPGSSEEARAERTALAALWLRRAVALDPRGASEAVAAQIGLGSDALEQVSHSIEARLMSGVLVPEALAELARLHHRRGDAVGAELARRAAEYVGADLEPMDAFALEYAQLQPSDWEAHVQVAAEAHPTAELLARVADPVAAALAGPPLPGLSGAERWQGEVCALFERLAVPRPRIGLAPDARWGGRLVPGPLVLVPAREAPLDEAARFYLGTLAAGFGRGRLLVLGANPAVVAGALAALRRGVTQEKHLISLEEALPVERRARLVAAAAGLEPADRAALAEAPEAVFAPGAVASLVEAFQATGRRAGLLACGDLTAALDVVLGRGGGSPRARRQALAAHPPALALLAWALSADHRVLLGRKGAA
jgi:hypothetical protein